MSGAHYFFKGFSLITKPGIRLFVIIPLIINIVLFSALTYLGWLQFATIDAIVKSWLPDYLVWLHWLIWPLFFLTVVLVVFFTFTWVTNFISAPFNGLLAEAVEQHLTGKILPPTPWHKVMTDLPTTLWGEIAKLFYNLLWLIPLTLLNFIPVINLFSPFFWFIFSAWMMTLQYADYPLGNHSLKPKAQRRLLRSKLFKSLEFGGITLLATMVPGLNFLVVPVAVAGATCMWIEEFHPSS
ncbi:MAG: sulfate transporter CysZ [Beggiatoa sp. IS2]|nr:MAG: sulfate transporter CysZ [Beggiatoa sp. IS2]